MPTTAENRSRRRGRMELLIQDLNALPKGYKPDDTEAALALALYARLNEVYDLAPEPEPEKAQASPEPEKPKGKGK